MGARLVFDRHLVSGAAAMSKHRRASRVLKYMICLFSSSHSGRVTSIGASRTHLDDSSTTSVELGHLFFRLTWDPGARSPRFLGSSPRAYPFIRVPDKNAQVAVKFARMARTDSRQLSSHPVSGVLGTFLLLPWRRIEPPHCLGM